MERQRIIDDYLKVYAGAGIFSTFIAALILLAWSQTHNGVDLFILAIIPLMAVTATVIVWAVMRYVLSWTYVNDPLYITLLFGQLLDASATSYGIDFHPHVQYVEQHAWLPALGASYQSAVQGAAALLASLVNAAPGAP